MAGLDRRVRGRRRPADRPRRANFIPLRHIADRTNTIVQWTEHDRGGHFAAMEQPALLVDDIREFFRKLRDAGRAPWGTG